MNEGLFVGSVALLAGPVACIAGADTPGGAGWVQSLVALSSKRAADS